MVVERPVVEVERLVGDDFSSDGFHEVVAEALQVGYNRFVFRDIVCPVSSESLNKRACRVGATLTAALLVLFFLTRWWPVLAFIVLDYVVRVFTSRTARIAFVVNGILRALRISAVPMNKAPKVFAWRVGFLMAVASAAMLPFSVAASGYIALALAAFNVLDGVCNFCVGCIIYTYFVLPRVRPGVTAG